MSVRVSVAMPAWNAAATLAAAIDSVLGQSFADLELIVVDDGSTDATAEIAAARAARDPRVRPIRQDHAGPGAARNRAIAAAGGELLAFLDADDLWEPDKLARQVAQLDARPEVGLTYTALTLIDGGGRPIGSFGVKPAYRGRCLDALLQANGPCQSSVLTRTALVRSVGGYDESLLACEDWDLWIRIAERAELDAIDTPLTRYRYHPGNVTRDVDRLREAHFRVLARNRERFGSSADSAAAHARAHLGYARRYAQLGNYGAALRDGALAIGARPLAASLYVAVAKALLRPLLGGRDNPNLAAQAGFGAEP